MGGPGYDRTITAGGPAPSAEGAAFAVGTQVGGRYEIVRYIAAGGMGEVYEAEDKVLGTRVALKAVRAAHAGSAAAVDRLKREIALARKVTHANICRVHDVGEHAGRAFLTMELLGGETLAERLKHGRLEDEEVERVAPQLVSALGALHAVGVVHRDFKSSNIMLDGDRVVVTDFGLARSSESDGDARLTVDAALLGTPAYMAPEQVEGREATAASDIYALGVVLYEMTTGALPFSEDTPLATATARLTQAPPVPATSARWQGVILRCLERAPEDRPRRVEDVLGAKRRRRGGIVLAAGGLVVVAAGIAVVFALSGGSEQAAAGACPSAASRLAGIWDPATRARIEARFSASDEDHVHDTWRGISAQLDEHSASWAHLWDEACAATDRVDDPLLHAQRLTCADHRLLELRAHASMLEDPAVDVHELSLGFSGHFLLQTISDCTSIPLLRAQPPAPPAQNRDEIEALMLRYHNARVQVRRAVNAGYLEGVDEGFAEFERVRAALVELGYPTGAVEIAWWHGSYLMKLGRFPEATERFDQAVAIAEDSRDDVMLVRAIAGQVEAAATGQRDYDPVAIDAAIARATTLLARIGDPPSARAFLAEAKAAHALRLRRGDDAIAAWSEARVAMERVGRQTDALTRREAIVELRSWDGDPRGVPDEAREIVAARERDVGASHQMLAVTLVGLAQVQYRTGEVETALRDVVRAIGIYEASLQGVASSNQAVAYYRAFIYARALGRGDESEGYLQAFADVQRRRTEGADQLSPYADVANLANGEGERVAAEYAARRAVESGRTAAERAPGYEELADLQLETGEPFGDEPWDEYLAELRPENRFPTLAVIEASRGHAAEATAYVAQTPDDLYARAVTEGMALLALGRSGEAVAPLGRALERLLDLFPWSNVNVGEVTAWLGFALLRSGDAAGAIEPLEEAVWVMGLCCGQRAVFAQDVRFALAQALWDTGGDRDRARALATKAHAALVAMGPSLAKKAAAIAAWLERH